MTDRTIAVLAADAAARIEEAKCKSRPMKWNDLESAHAAAKTPRESADVVTDAVSTFCSGCPAIAACAQWAAADHYDGLAAGAPYKNGKRMSSRWVSQRAGRPPSTARAS